MSLVEYKFQGIHSIMEYNTSFSVTVLQLHTVSQMLNRAEDSLPLVQQVYTNGLQVLMVQIQEILSIDLVLSECSLECP